MLRVRQLLSTIATTQCDCQELAADHWAAFWHAPRRSPESGWPAPDTLPVNRLGRCVLVALSDGPRQRVDSLAVALENLRYLGPKIARDFRAVCSELQGAGQPTFKDWETFSPEKIKNGKYKSERTRSDWTRILVPACENLTGWWDSVDSARVALRELPTGVFEDERLPLEERWSTRLSAHLNRLAGWLIDTEPSPRDAPLAGVDLPAFVRLAREWSKQDGPGARQAEAFENWQGNLCASPSTA